MKWTAIFCLERDRDRLRERQRQERQQMLPNDEKEINVGVQDLFHAPVKVHWPLFKIINGSRCILKGFVGPSLTRNDVGMANNNIVCGGACR